MRSAEEWASLMENEIGDGSASLADFRNYVRAIQADALRAATAVCRRVRQFYIDDEYQEPIFGAVGDCLDDIIALIPSEATP